MLYQLQETKDGEHGIAKFSAAFGGFFWTMILYEIKALWIQNIGGFLWVFYSNFTNFCSEASCQPFSSSCCERKE